MKRYADYTKDDLMLLLESLTPGGSEFHESPTACVEFVRGRYSASVSLKLLQRKAVAERDTLLMACENLLAYRKRAGAVNFQLEKADDYFRLIVHAIAAAKGDA